MTAVEQALEECRAKIEAITGEPVKVCYGKPLLTNQKRDDIVNKICSEFSVGWADIKGTSRNHNVALARHVFCFICNARYNVRITDLQKQLNVSHSAIVRAIQKIEGFLKVNDPAAHKIINILNQLNNEVKIK